MSGPEDLDQERRRIVRKVRLLTWGVAGLAVLLAIGGGALLAWFLTGAGFPFLRTWVILSLLLLAVPGLVHLWPGPRPWEAGGDDE
mgnify:CR=1 FL=1